MIKDKDISSRFADEWLRYDYLVKNHMKQFLQWISPIEPEIFKDKTVLDAGCGMGRNSFWALDYGAEQLVAIDADQRTVDVAEKLLFPWINSEAYLMSIYDLPSIPSYDIVMCIGVIHHLFKPRAAIDKLLSVCKPGGTVIVWVYGNQQKLLLPIIKFLRLFTSRLPTWIVHLFTYCISIPLFFLLRLVPFRNNYFKQISTFDFYHVHSIIFDQLIPKVSNYYSKEQLQGLLAGIKGVEIYENRGMSWTIVIKKGEE